MTEPILAPNTAPLVTSEQYDLIRRTVAKDATPEELQLYLHDCQRQGVHPLDKLIYFTKRAGKYTPVTSIDLLRSRAADTGEHAGTDQPIYCGVPEGDDFVASVTVYRMVQGQRCSWTASARWAEYKPGPNQDMMWKKMPHLMLGKCAEALALRKAFPRQLAGIYTQEEMAQSGRVDVVTGEILEPTPAPLNARQRKIMGLRELAQQARAIGLDPNLGTPKNLTDAQLDQALSALAAMIENEY